ncbi:MAG: Nif3-like dinuclear metal center hexameric protein [Bacteroidales bacterium]|nr:Nif3-like dinuclear metal center hexameric protein [Bacteroidales bacterium]MCF8333157.1 Nif3-like dinuclear metal center hexameric protein [Bacteroidales bacterium]
MKIKEVTSYLDQTVPLMLQESYDNSGLLLGDEAKDLKGMLLTVDVTEEVVSEAVRKNCNLIIAHHPIIFKGLKKITGQNHVERTVEAAIKNDIAVYAAHTNLDSVDFGVSKMLADKVGMQNQQVLEPKENLLKKLATFCPVDYAEKVRKAIFEAGAGKIGEYDSCSFNLEGRGSFKPGEGTDPFVGEKNQLHYEREERIETVYPLYLEDKVLKALFESHPYEEVAYDVYPLDNKFDKVGHGMIGELKEAYAAEKFLEKIKKELGIGCIRHSTSKDKQVKKVAVCGGSGSFLIDKAKKAGADMFITADMKYHEFFEADKDFILVDIGHHESEKYTKDLLNQLIIKKFPNFAPTLSEIDTNPINYL